MIILHFVQINTAEKISLTFKMIFKCFVIITSIKALFCAYPANFDKDQLAKSQRESQFYSNTANASTNLIFSSVSNTDTYGFPDVIYPTSILDNQPFYFNVNGDLGPFGKEVKSSFKNISSVNKKNKERNLSKSHDNDEKKLSSQPNPLMCKENHIANRENEKTTSGQDNKINTFIDINKTAGNSVSTFLQNNTTEVVSQVSPSSSSKNSTNVIEKYGTYNDSLIDISDTTPIKIEDPDDIIQTSRNETLNPICEPKNTLFEKTSKDEYQQQTHNSSVEEIQINTEENLIRSYSSDNTFSTKFQSSIGTSSKENECSYPLLHLFKSAILDEISNSTDNLSS